MSKMLAPTWLAQRLRQLGDIRRNSQRLDQINFRFAQVCRRISYKHRRTIIKPRSAASCARAWSLAGSGVKSGKRWTRERRRGWDSMPIRYMEITCLLGDLYAQNISCHPTLSIFPAVVCGGICGE